MLNLTRKVPNEIIREIAEAGPEDKKIMIKKAMESYRVSKATIYRAIKKYEEEWLGMKRSK